MTIISVHARQRWGMKLAWTQCVMQKEYQKNIGQIKFHTVVHTAATGI